MSNVPANLHEDLECYDFSPYEQILREWLTANASEKAISGHLSREDIPDGFHMATRIIASCPQIQFPENASEDDVCASLKSYAALVEYAVAVNELASSLSSTESARSPRFHAL